MPLQSDLASLQPGINSLTQLILGDQNARRQNQQKADLDVDKANREQQNSLATLKQLQNEAPDGASVRVGDLSSGVDPYVAAQRKMMQGGASAIQSAVKAYQSGVPKIQDALGSAFEGLQAVNDPNNRMARGQAKTLMLKSLGMNRFNEQEAKSLLPNSIYGSIANIGNAADNDATPLTQNEQSALNSAFMTAANTAHDKHQQLVQNVTNGYAMNPFADPSRESQLANIGAPIENSFQQKMSVFKKAPTNPTFTGGGTPTQPQSLVDKLTSFFRPSQQGGGQAPQAAGGMDMQSAAAREIAVRAAKRKAGGQ